ncbi:MAG: hypothetical protein K8M05_11325 [Deltaproteobacteria bacterium]|nr:hypothetical protein [Kofleriaceae bacterium]
MRVLIFASRAACDGPAPCDARSLAVQATRTSSNSSSSFICATRDGLIAGDPHSLR